MADSKFIYLSLVLIFGACISPLRSESTEKFRILALLPWLGKSHFYFAEVLFEELAKRGHDITVVSHYPRKTPIPNYHDISISSGRPGVHIESMEEVGKGNRYIKMIEFFQRGIDKVCREGLSHPNLQKLIKSKTEKFDILLVEAFNADCFLGFQHKFQVPVVAIRTSTLSTWIIERTGSPANPSYVPGTTVGLPSRMNFLQRAHNLFDQIFMRIAYRYYGIESNEIARRHFGNDMPDLETLAKNTSLFLIDTHYLYQSARPLTPNIKEVGGLHVKKVKPLPKDLENWISGASRGVIYMNLGSMLNPASMHEDKRKAFLGCFAKLPYRVLMKWKDETMPDLPPNVKLITWAPQNDVLHHPNVKLFISHGGMLGLVEAIDAGVPLIVIPFFGDQPTNAALIGERGLGVVLEYVDITFNSLDKVLREVLNDEKYLARSRELSAAFRDRILPPLEEAAFWVEYVARHRGAPFMRSSALELPLYSYLLLDVLLALVLGLCAVRWIFNVIGKAIRKICKSHEDINESVISSYKKNN